MQPNATIIENLPDAMAFLQEMEAQDVEIYGGFRPLARRATAEIIEKAMHDAVDKHLDAIEQTCEAPDRRNGTYRRNLLTAIGDIELNVPRTRRYCPPRR